MKKSVVILSLVTCAAFAISLMLFSSHMHWKTAGKTDLARDSIESLKDCFNCAEQYKEERFGDRYELYGVSYEWKDGEKDDVTFTYTKRSGLFKDVYFVTIKRLERAITCRGQAEANRLFGRDLHLKPETWKFDFNTLEEAGKIFSYDELDFETHYEEAIAVKYRSNGEVVYVTEFNAVSGEAMY